MSTSSQTDTKTWVVTSQAPSPPVIVRPFDVVPNPATIMVAITGTLTYNIEITGNDPNDPTTPVLWFPMTGFTGLSNSITGTLGACISAIRINVTAFTSGSATFQFCQLRRA